MLVPRRSTYRSRQSGDTIIEVLLAITIFSLVAVAGLSIMNQGSATSQRSLEITLVRQQMDAQAEALRYINTAYVAAFKKSGNYSEATPAGQWVKLTNASSGKLRDQASQYGTCTPPDKAFVMNTRTGRVSDVALTPAETFSQATYDDTVMKTAGGIWAEAVRSTATSIDFHIRTCWDSPGQEAPMTLGTIVRLYEPQN